MSKEKLLSGEVFYPAEEVIHYANVKDWELLRRTAEKERRTPRLGLEPRSKAPEASRISSTLPGPLLRWTLIL